ESAPHDSLRLQVQEQMAEIDRAARSGERAAAAVPPDASSRTSSAVTEAARSSEQADIQAKRRRRLRRTLSWAIPLATVVIGGAVKSIVWPAFSLTNACSRPRPMNPGGFGPKPNRMLLTVPLGSAARISARAVFC